MTIAEVPIGKYGHLAGGTLFKVPENPLNHNPENRERMVLLLWPGTVAADERMFPPGTPCKDSPFWNQ